MVDQTKRPLSGALDENMARFVTVNRTDSASWDVKGLSDVLLQRASEEKASSSENDRRATVRKDGVTTVRRTDCASLTLRGSGNDYALLRERVKASRCCSDSCCTDERRKAVKKLQRTLSML